MVIDRISNMLSSLKNASMAGKGYVETVYTKECEGIAKVLKEKGFLEDVKIFKDKGKSFKNLRLDLSKDDYGYKLKEVSRISKPGRRVYSPKREIHSVTGGNGVLVVSTSRGIMSGDDARKKKLGGEIICKVY